MAQQKPQVEQSEGLAGNPMLVTLNELGPSCGGSRDTARNLARELKVEIVRTWTDDEAVTLSHATLLRDTWAARMDALRSREDAYARWQEQKQLQYRQHLQEEARKRREQEERELARLREEHRRQAEERFAQQEAARAAERVARGEPDFSREAWERAGRPQE